MKSIDNFLRAELVLKSLTAGIWEYNVTTDRVFFSPTWKSDLGYKDWEICDTSFEKFLSFVHPDDAEKLRNSFHAYLARKTDKYEIEFRMKMKDGSYKWFLSRGSGVWDDEGKAVYVAGIHLNIHEKKIKEETLINSEKRFSQLFKQVKDIMFLVNLDEGGRPLRFKDVNDAACEKLGYSKEEFLELSLYDIKPPEYHHEIDNPSPLLDIDHLPFESVLLTKDGSAIPVEVYCQSLIFDGEIVKLCIQRDISESKRADELLKKSEARYQTLVDLSPDAIIVSKNQTILYCNPSAVKMGGLKSPEELIGVSISKLIGDENALIAYEREQKIVLDGRPLTGEYAVEKTNGEVVHIESTGSLIPFGEDTAVLSIVRDITERKKLEKELQDKAKENEMLLLQSNEYDRFKTEFFSNISHELKTPLNILLGAIQLIQQKQTEVQCSFRCTKHINIMKQNSYRLLRLVNNLIDITRIDSGYFNLDKSDCNIVTIIEEITLSVAKYIESKGIALVFNTSVEELWLACDLDKIERIMLNLLSNAIKFTKAGGSITVSITNTSDNVFISVKDTGIGIPEEKQEIIFQRFRQADNLLSRKAEGSGIGLSLVKALVEAHEGAISLNSKLGEGSEFIVELPIKSIEGNYYEDTISSDYNDINIERIRIEFSDIYSLR